jgi:hypothetical protein
MQLVPWTPSSGNGAALVFGFAQRPGHRKKCERRRRPPNESNAVQMLPLSLEDFNLRPWAHPKNQTGSAENFRPGGCPEADRATWSAFHFRLH